jgi:hypothetical protein
VGIGTRSPSLTACISVPVVGWSSTVISTPPGISSGWLLNGWDGDNHPWRTPRSPWIDPGELSLHTGRFWKRIFVCRWLGPPVLCRDQRETVIYVALPHTLDPCGGVQSG